MLGLVEGGKATFQVVKDGGLSEGRVQRYSQIANVHPLFFNQKLYFNEVYFIPFVLSKPLFISSKVKNVFKHLPFSLLMYR